MRLLHPRHRDACQGADRQEGIVAHARRHETAPRGAPLPLHRLREDPRRHRGRRPGDNVRAGAVGGDRRWRRQVRGCAARPRRPRLHRRHPRARHAPRCTPPHRSRPRRHRGDRRECCARRRGHHRGLHCGRHHWRPAGGDHPQGLAGHDPGRRHDLLPGRRGGDRGRRDAGAGQSGARTGRGGLRRPRPEHRSGGRTGAGCTALGVGYRFEHPLGDLLPTWRRCRADARGERVHRARDVPDPAHRARLPRTGVDPRHPVGRGRRPDPARVLRRPGRVGRPRRHRQPCSASTSRPDHGRARLERRSLRRQGGHVEPGPRSVGGVVARPPGEVHLVARGELPHPRQTASDHDGVRGRMRRRRPTHGAARARIGTRAPTPASA